MYRTGGYTGDDRMCDLVCDRYAVLQVMSRFGIALGFGDKTIAEVCEENRVDAATFLAVVNMLMGLGVGADVSSEVSVRTLTDYLHNAHGYFLDFRLPAIRRKLIEAIDCSSSDVAFAILRFFDEYVAEVQRHMAYEEQTVFPYNELGIGRLIYRLPFPLCENFLKEIFGEEIPESFDEDTTATINRFFQNNLNIAETSRQLHMHRNTLIYRLEQIQKRTGLDLRVFEDAMTFKVATMVINYIHAERNQ